ncbi:hypothetical protein G647_04401 [Cladophialophora carrionii CBS 160.54]|uniref:Integral membrane protein n=1 Tax=Cladophialophora carrionii CBS 160.54 TaxID=1279043 RepID=V9DED2_9EURO|nr:uncharacterized protein G647_04401 [Cladophialophora carrionii CBS 160.54]ETI25031.1 hypothetical protein G647_04401 [Cladophialophora carrionii CBS 160.54]
MGVSRWTVAAVLLQLASQTLAHGHDEGHDMDMKKPEAPQHKDGEVDPYDMPSYAGLGQHQTQIFAHVALMVLAWFFILPIASMFSIARSRYALPVQFLFLAVNGLGLLFGIVYNINTPDLYVHNAHHRIGWIATWMVTALVITNLLFCYSRRGKQSTGAADERAAFLPVSIENMAQHDAQPYAEYRWSGHGRQDSSDSSTLHSRDDYPTVVGRRDTLDDFEKPEPEPEPEDDEELPTPQRPRRHLRWLRIDRVAFVDRYLSARLPNLVSTKAFRAIKLAYNVLDRLILLLGFITMVTGFVTYCGLFRANNVFTGLAHFIKGGIFFWYGLLTLGRWMGCFADLGWAWNVKPSRDEVAQWKSKIPSAEFTESFVIWLYGASNVFLEHLAAWGNEWTAQDFEHVSIAVMFFGGGLCGMLAESPTIRRYLNTVVDEMPARKVVHPSDDFEVREVPKQYTTSVNPMPALIIILLGVMMSSHHQDSMVATQVHSQWGILLVGFGVARMCTYLLMFLSPPKSVYPARPPTELVASFCLISGGIIFCASARDIVHYMERTGLMAMFVLTVTCGFTAFIMAYEIIVLSLKGWAIRKEGKALVSTKF